MTSGRIEGRNTDATGLAESLREGLGADFVKAKVAVVLGAGGAARAAAVALHNLGAAEIRILNRGRGRADQLATRAGAAAQAEARRLRHGRVGQGGARRPRSSSTPPAPA